MEMKLGENPVPDSEVEAKKEWFSDGRRLLHQGQYNSEFTRDIVENTEKTNEEKIKELLLELRKAEEELGEWYGKEIEVKDKVTSLRRELTHLKIDTDTGKSMYEEAESIYE